MGIFIKSDDLKNLLSLHLQKDEKLTIFEEAFNKMYIEGNLKFKLSWSWWAFFGGWLYFLYRKMYLLAGIFFIISILISKLTPDVAILIMIVTGVSAKYFYLKKFLQDLEISGYKESLNQDIENRLKKLGGYHQWVIYMVYLFLFILLLGIIFTMLLPSFLPKQ